MTETATAADTARDEKIKRGNEAAPENGVKCELDGKWVHSIPLHLKYNHPTVSVSDYRMRFPDSATVSPHVLSLRAKREAEETAVAGPAKAVTPFAVPVGSTVTALSKVFGMRHSAVFNNAHGEPIQCTVLAPPEPEVAMFSVDLDENYVWDVELLKDILTGVLLNTPTLAWGYHGTGKSSCFEQFCARTNRPMIRVQHTVSTEEAHILGQMTVKPNPDTGQNMMVFEPGPLAFAMRYGLIYLADEYDFALPSVTSVYQPVMEGKQLIIKEAPPEWRIVKPHPNFRFFATGNTNGSGDESGLYQGTQIMNAANYSRFGMTMQVNYMEADFETQAIVQQAGIKAEDAKKLVQFAKHVRDSYANGEITVTVSPRELINAAKIALVRGLQWRLGLQKAYINRLSTTDRKAVDDFAQRIFGGSHK